MKDVLETKAVEIMTACKDMAIATLREDGFPQATTVSFVHDGLEIFFGVGATSQKARNMRRDNRVSITMTPPYEDWSGIRGLSLAGHAAEMTAPGEISEIARLMIQRFPQVSGMELAERGEAVFFRVIPTVMSVLDYSKGFGHTDMVRLDDSDIAENLESMQHKWLIPTGGG
ncbi:pyridoxamine 5'-phosphate oxidase family protein [Henriciella aquimarina]|uniref:pyridoxamine 5'-phosphate oxidase family protein n=1 Tax=Henriciella aquimarina TaxID=545261 RepID=UPI000A01604D|nr:pyridoxamine 5'-phosphate oxidase family protein [Henriciella aquimarina]